MAIALVTGGNRGIGRAVVEQLAEDGHTTIVGCRDEVDGRAVATPLVDAGHDVDVVVLDVADPGSVDRAVAAVQERHGGLDVLVNNAGIDDDTDQTPTDADLERVRTILEVNTLGPWRVAQGFAELLRRSGHGRVVNVSSGSGQLRGMGAVAPGYSVSKAALNAVTRQLADELAADGVLVNSVCPGWVRTDMGGSSATRAPDEGAAGVVWAVTLPDDGPTGGFFRDGEPIDW